jgi:hypothetical protein
MILDLKHIFSESSQTWTSSEGFQKTSRTRPTRAIIRKLTIGDLKAGMHFVIGNELKHPINGKIDEIKKIVSESGAISYEIWLSRERDGRYIWKTIYSNNGSTITEEYDLDY